MLNPCDADSPNIGQGAGAFGPTHKNWAKNWKPTRGGAGGIGRANSAAPIALLLTLAAKKTGLLGSTRTSIPRKTGGGGVGERRVVVWSRHCVVLNLTPDGDRLAVNSERFVSEHMWQRLVQAAGGPLRLLELALDGLL